MLIQDNSASLLISKDKECIDLFIEFIKNTYQIKHNDAVLICNYFVTDKWKYVYLFDKNWTSCSNEPMIFQEDVIEKNHIICFTDDKYSKPFKIGHRYK